MSGLLNLGSGHLKDISLRWSLSGKPPTNIGTLGLVKLKPGGLQRYCVKCEYWLHFIAVAAVGIEVAS